MHTQCKRCMHDLQLHRPPSGADTRRDALAKRALPALAAQRVVGVRLLLAGGFAGAATPPRLAVFDRLGGVQLYSTEAAEGQAEICATAAVAETAEPVQTLSPPSFSKPAAVAAAPSEPPKTEAPASPANPEPELPKTQAPASPAKPEAAVGKRNDDPAESDNTANEAGGGLRRSSRRRQQKVRSKSNKFGSVPSHLVLIFLPISFSFRR